MLQKFKFSIYATFFLTLAPLGFCDVKLPAIFSDHAVIQKDVQAPVWGWAEPNEEVTVKIGMQSQSTKAGADGKWKVKLDKLSAGGPHTLEIKGKNTITIKDVLIGEVWLGSGQSNMAMTVNRCLNYEKEQAAANFPQLRMFRESSGVSTQPQFVGAGKWEVCTPETVGGFSGTAYFFGRELHQVLKVPVGLINSSVGGTPVESWTSMEAQKDFKELKPLFDRWQKSDADFNLVKAEAQYKIDLEKHKIAAKKAKDDGKPIPRVPQKPNQPRLNNHFPGNLFNGKISPLIPYAIKGAIWYQGESNAGKGNAEVYGLQLAALINDWRSRWGQGDFYFAWVQLPNFHKLQTDPIEESGWVTVREEMANTLKLANTGMAITTDVGEANDIHPKDKQNVGKRLAMWALAKAYNQEKIASSGPLFSSHEVKGKEVIIRFTNTNGGLKSSGPELKGFAIAGADKKWKFANARIEGETVIVSSPDINAPLMVRFAWADNPIATLFNGAGIPAAPFRTDK